MSDPAVPLVNNPELTPVAPDHQPDRPTGHRLDHVGGHVGAVETRPTAKRTEAIRDSAIVARRDPARDPHRHAGGAVAGAPAAHAARRRPQGCSRRPGARNETGAVAGGAVGPSSRCRCTPPRKSGRSRTPLTNCTSRPCFLAGEQADLQMQVGDMFETLSRRSRSLVDQQLALIDDLERNEEDPQRLESLFRLDHLAARMRRNGANLLVLAGATIPREQADPVPVAATRQRRGLRGRGLRPCGHRDGARQRGARRRRR